MTQFKIGDLVTPASGEPNSPGYFRQGDVARVIGYRSSGGASMHIEWVKNHIEGNVGVTHHFSEYRFELYDGSGITQTVRDAVKNAFDASTIGLLQDNVVVNVLKALNERHNIV